MNDFFSGHKILRYNPTLEYKVKTRLTRLRKLIIHIKTERNSPMAVPFSTRLRAWNLGFTSLSYTLYNLEKNDPTHYLRDFSDINFRLNNPGAAAVNDKFNFSRTMKLLGLASPEIFLFIDRGAVLSYSEGRPANDLRCLITTLLEKQKILVFKPAFKGAGLGIFFVEIRGGKWLVNGTGAEPSEIVSFVKRQRYYLVTEFVRQAAYAEKIYPHTANTVRLLTIWDEKNGMPFISAAAHRIGSRTSFPVDNFHGGLGGLSARIDMNSGELGPGVCLSETGRILHLEKHPETGEQIKGLIVPLWQETKEKVLIAASHFAGAPYVGWDLVITEKACSFLEGNSPPGTVVWQVHKPFLIDPQLRSFYRDQGML